MKRLPVYRPNAFKTRHWPIAVYLVSVFVGSCQCNLKEGQAVGTVRSIEMFCEGLHCVRAQKQTVTFLMRVKLQRCMIAALELAATHSAVLGGGGGRRLGQTRQRFPLEWAEETLKY